MVEARDAEHPAALYAGRNTVVTSILQETFESSLYQSGSGNESVCGEAGERGELNL